MEYMNRKERDSNDYMYDNESVSDLVTIGSVVAVQIYSISCIKREERRNKLRSILNLLFYDSTLSRISSCTHSRTEMESRGSISAMYRIATE
jgi:hypothetical protein